MKKYSVPPVRSSTVKAVVSEVSTTPVSRSVLLKLLSHIWTSKPSMVEPLAIGTFHSRRISESLMAVAVNSGAFGARASTASVCFGVDQSPAPLPLTARTRYAQDYVISTFDVFVYEQKRCRRRDRSTSCFTEIGVVVVIPHVLNYITGKGRGTPVSRQGRGPPECNCAARKGWLTLRLAPLACLTMTPLSSRSLLATMGQCRHWHCSSRACGRSTVCWTGGRYVHTPCASREDRIWWV